MSVSPPCASPLERVQSTRARFVRAKPDPVLRFLKNFMSLWFLWWQNPGSNAILIFQHWASARRSSCHWNQISARGGKCFLEYLFFFSDYHWPTFTKVGDYMHKVQRDLVPSHRKIVTDWMLEVRLILYLVSEGWFVIFMVFKIRDSIVKFISWISISRHGWSHFHVLVVPGDWRARMQPPSVSLCSSIPWPGPRLLTHQKVSSRCWSYEAEMEVRKRVSVGEYQLDFRQTQLWGLCKCNRKRYRICWCVWFQCQPFKQSYHFQNPTAAARLGLPVARVEAARPSPHVSPQPRRLHRLLHLRPRASVHGDARPWKAQVVNIIFWSTSFVPFECMPGG